MADPSSVETRCPDCGHRQMISTSEMAAGCTCERCESDIYRGIGDVSARVRAPTRTI